jgi:hypothetical protein
LDINRNRQRLDTLPMVRKEMARLYRAAKANKIEPEKASRLVYMLREIRVCLESEMLVGLEERMAAILQRTHARLPHLGNIPSGSTVDVSADNGSAINGAE